MNKSYRYPKQRRTPRGNQKFKKAFLLLALVIVALLAIGYFRLYGSSNDKTSKDASSAAQKAQANADVKQKKQVIEKGDSGNTSSQDSTSTSRDSGSAITGLTARQEANGTVTVLTKLTSNTEGTCVLTIKNGAKTVTKNAAIIFQPEFSTCEGYSIPISQLGSGNWSITLSAGSSVKTITLQVAL